MSGDQERERRQLDLAAGSLGAYRRGDISLGRLIADLDALWTEFRLAPDEWLEAFREYWWTLEQVHAVALDRDLVNLPEDLRVMVDEAVDELRFMLDEYPPPIGEG